MRATQSRGTHADDALVDDKKPLMMVTAEMLSRLGYDSEPSSDLHALAARLSSRRMRNMSSVLRPPYNMNHAGVPCALFTSAMLALSTVERIIWCLRLPAARATATPAG
jgi:hypothetical protein